MSQGTLSGKKDLKMTEKKNSIPYFYTSLVQFPFQVVLVKKHNYTIKKVVLLK